MSGAPATGRFCSMRSPLASFLAFGVLACDQKLAAQRYASVSGPLSQPGRCTRRSPATLPNRMIRHVRLRGIARPRKIVRRPLAKPTPCYRATDNASRLTTTVCTNVEHPTPMIRSSSASSSSVLSSHRCNSVRSRSHQRAASEQPYPRP